VPSRDLDLEPPPLVTASALLAARPFALASGIAWSGIDDLPAATGASPEPAYEMEDALRDQLAVVAVLGKAQPPPPDLAGVDERTELVELAIEMLRFLKQYPGCAQSGARERYADCFRRFVLELWTRYPEVTVAEFAAAIDLPPGTLADWLRGGRHGVDRSAQTKYQRATRGARGAVT
jgi:hypothetical protein